MSPDTDPKAPKPGKESAPTRVKEPDNTRPPNEPTPRHPEKPQSFESDAEEKGE